MADDFIDPLTAPVDVMGDPAFGRLLATNPDAAIPHLANAGITPEQFFSQPGMEGFNFMTPDAAPLDPSMAPAAQPTTQSAAAGKPLDISGGSQSLTKAINPQAQRNTSGARGMSGVQAPAAPAVQHISSPHVPMGPAGQQNNALPALLAQILSGAATPQPPAMRLRQALEGGR